MNPRILCLGDIHLGRRPSGLPENLDDYGINTADLTPNATWRTAIDWACEQEVDAVLMAGDVVDNEKDRFEAYGHLASGVRKLVSAGIPVYAVAGNHDSIALPRLADQIPEVKLLGRGGRWETVELPCRNGTRIRLMGKSFEGKTCRDDPMRDFVPNTDTDVPTIAVLHCDLDNSGSVYAPVKKADLEAAPVAAWLLGHVHKPSDLRAPRPIGYLGSICGLDPGEPGAHGPWLATIQGPATVMMEHLPMAHLRWEREPVPIEAIQAEDGEGLGDALLGGLKAAMQRVHERIVDESLGPRVVGCRTLLTGRSQRHRDIRHMLPEFDLQQIPIGDVHYFVEQIEDEAGPALDLENIAAGKDPPALLARRLLAVKNGGSEAQAIISAAGEHLRHSLSSSRWSGLDAYEAHEQEIRKLLIKAGTDVLEELIATVKHSTTE